MRRRHSRPARRAPVDPARLRRLRFERGLASGELAERAGISPQHLSGIESGANGVSPGAAARLAAALGCDLADLLHC